MPPSLMQPFLIYVLARKLAENDVSDAAFGRALGKDRSTAKRLLDGGSGYSREGGMDAAVSAVADLTGARPMTLWADALKEWRADPEATYLPTRHEGLRAERLRPGDAASGDAA